LCTKFPITKTRNCREKKTKCEPGGESCLQCKKAKRQCHRFASPRSVAKFLPRVAQIELQITKISERKAVIAAPWVTNGEGDEDCWRISEAME
jgi:hypothetical protein